MEASPQTITPTDETQLGQLAVAFRVLGTLFAVCSNFAWIHFFIGIGVMTGSFGKTQKTDPIGPIFGAFFTIFAFCFIAGGITCGVLGWKVAKHLETRTNHKFCTIMSCIYLLFQPLGTALGILALIVIGRPNVKAVFAQNDQ